MKQGVWIQCSLGKSIDYPEALSIRLNKYWETDFIYALTEVKGFKSSIYLFPELHIEEISEQEDSRHRHENFVFYGMKWYKPQDIFKNVPLDFCLNRESVKYFCQSVLKAHRCFKIDYNYIDLASPKQAEFKQEAIQPLRNLFSKRGFIIDGRGKHRKILSEATKKRNEVIFKTYIKVIKKRSGKERPYPYKEIKKLLPTKEIYKGHSVFYNISDDTMRRVIDKGRSHKSCTKK